jgi:hypothetical protein
LSASLSVSSATIRWEKLMTEFEESVHEIEGLTAFSLWTLPEWLSMRLDYMFVSRKEGPLSDADFVDEFIRGEWLDYWGTATIDGKEVWVFEYCDEDIFELYEPAYLAEMLFCGLVMVEPSRSYRGGIIACFTEHRATMPRQKKASVELAHCKGLRFSRRRERRSNSSPAIIFKKRKRFDECNYWSRFCGQRNQ